MTFVLCPYTDAVHLIPEARPWLPFLLRLLPQHERLRHLLQILRSQKKTSTTVKEKKNNHFSTFAHLDVVEYRVTFWRMWVDFIFSSILLVETRRRFLQKYKSLQKVLIWAEVWYLFCRNKCYPSIRFFVCVLLRVWVCWRVAKLQK